MSENVFVEEKQPEQVQINFATVTGVHADGLTLRFDGETEPTQKRYKCNSFVVFAVNDRVRIIKDSGTYVVEYPVGNPKTSFNASYAYTAGYATSAGSATKATNADNATNATTATGVDNTGTSYSDIEFRCPYSNQIEYRVKGGAWHILKNA